MRRKQPTQLTVITDEEVELIHRTSLRILWEIGVRFPNEEMLHRFAAAGANVDFDRQVVRIPEDLVEAAIQALPKNFRSAPADGGPPITLGDGDLKLSMDTSSHLVIYSCHCHSLDLARMNTQYGAPEQALLAVGGTQLAKRYGLAISGNVMLTDSNTLDYMAGFQQAATATYALAAGWDRIDRRARRRRGRTQPGNRHRGG